jgi:hypothetical protein
MFLCICATSALELGEVPPSPELEPDPLLLPLPLLLLDPSGPPAPLDDVLLPSSPPVPLLEDDASLPARDASSPPCCGEFDPLVLLPQLTATRSANGPMPITKRRFIRKPPEPPS